MLIYQPFVNIFITDRHSNASDIEKQEQERMFKEVGEAYAVLSDPKEKARYDSGQDFDDMDGMDGMGSGWGKLLLSIYFQCLIFSKI